MEHGKTNWIWTDHILNQMEERKLSRELVEAALDDPDDKVIVILGDIYATLALFSTTLRYPDNNSD